MKVALLGFFHPPQCHCENGAEIIRAPLVSRRYHTFLASSERLEDLGAFSLERPNYLIVKLRKGCWSPAKGDCHVSEAPKPVTRC